ncbi:MAG: hypothetical protein ACI87E_003231, partial [Mariniblastus sp.]
TTVPGASPLVDLVSSGPLRRSEAPGDIEALAR